METVGGLLGGSVRRGLQDPLPAGDGDLFFRGLSFGTGAEETDGDGARTPDPAG